MMIGGKDYKARKAIEGDFFLKGSNSSLKIETFSIMEKQSSFEANFRQKKIL
jgi:hypothetical protein